MEIRLVNDVDDSSSRDAARAPHWIAEGANQETGTSLDIENLVRKYWLLLVLLVCVGALGGVASVVLSSPMYKARLLLEVQSVNEAWLKNSIGGMSFEANDVNIQTQINILQGGSFVKRGSDRLQPDIVPMAPTGRDLFSRLRQRIRPATQDPLESSRRSLNIAMATFDARPVNKTRLIELTCESTSPDIAAQFLNAMAAEFVEDNSQSRMQSSQKTSEWLSAQIEETKSKLHDLEERLREFVQASGNLFVGPESPTLADTEMSQAKSKLAEVQSLRIAAQTRYELSLKNPPESLAEVQNDGTLHSFQQQITHLRQERAALTTTYTPKHEKVQKVDAQIAQLEQAYQQQRDAIVKKIRDDYEALLKSERRQAEYYHEKSQLVSAEAGKAAQYSALKREVETLRGSYQSLLMQANQAGLGSSVPLNPIRIVEPSSPPAAPYKPQPLLNILLGTVLGLAGTAGFVFLKERMDRSVGAPGSLRSFLQTPELGVIPNLNLVANSGAKLLPGAPLVPDNGHTLSIAAKAGDDVSQASLALWSNGSSFIAESFRGTLASILRAQGQAKTQRAILITSPGPGEGKTTVVQNLGIALAETGRKILLVDADFRRPHLHKRFHLPNDHSLIDLIREEKPLADCPAEYWGLSTGMAGLSVLPNRPTDNNVARALYSPRLRAIFQRLREMYDMVLVDAPPVLHLADARIVAPLTDAAILVLRSGVTERKSAMEAFRRMQEDGLFLLGTVLTGWDVSNSYLKRHYYYDYAEGDRE
ncbi:MAG: polysaccharide biosynthesis tyrosine autokinase [Acidobacteriia bacterium]|nr:polysaccharide biosynthesis tyrosine autokinase [Terriglobia bacterium]